MQNFLKSDDKKMDPEIPGGCLNKGVEFT